MDNLIYVTIGTDVSVRTEVLIYTLDHNIWGTKSLMFKHHVKEMKTMQTIKYLMIQIFQLYHCDINGTTAKIIF